MQIHNWFSDVLLSISTLFDNHIFPNNYIKHYEFNIANRSFTLDYNTEFHYPNAIIELVDDSYSFGAERPNVTQKTSVPNYHQCKIITDNNFSIFVQEEMTNIHINAHINAEDLLQAREIEYRIKTSLPLNKYFQLLSFNSFLEIEQDYINRCGINYRNNINNLFMKLFPETGNVNYCFSINYKPLIKLNSSNINITDTSSSIDLDIEYMIQKPMWLIGDKYNTIERINLEFQRFGNEPITSSSKLMSLYDRNLESEITFRNIIIPDFDHYNFDILDDDNYILSVKFNKKDFKFNNLMKFELFDIYDNFNSIIPTLIDEKDNEIRFIILKDDYNNKYNTSLNKPVILRIYMNREDYIENNDSEVIL